MTNQSNWLLEAWPKWQTKHHGIIFRTDDSLDNQLLLAIAGTYLTQDDQHNICIITHDDNHREIYKFLEEKLPERIHSIEQTQGYENKQGIIFPIKITDMAQMPPDYWRQFSKNATLLVTELNLIDNHIGDVINRSEWQHTCFLSKELNNIDYVIDIEWCRSIEIIHVDGDIDEAKADDDDDYYNMHRHAWRSEEFSQIANQLTYADFICTWSQHEQIRYLIPKPNRAWQYTKNTNISDIQKPINKRPHSLSKNSQKAIKTIQTWTQGIEAAANDEREKLKKLHQTLTDEQRHRDGIAITNLTTKYYKNNYLITQSKQQPITATLIMPGSEVTIVPSNNTEELLTGVVESIDSYQIKIKINQDDLPRLPRTYTVNLTYNAKTYDAYRAGLTAARQALQTIDPKNSTGPDQTLRAALLGETKPTKTNEQYQNEELTDSQQEVIQKIIEGRLINLIHGPPGTGKTHTIAAITKELTNRQQTILVTAESNTAVDNMVRKLRQTGQLVIRLGYRANLTNKDAEKCHINPTETQHWIDWCKDNKIIIATTNYGAYQYIDAKLGLRAHTFDYVIHDEAGQATAPSSLLALMRANRFILAGDPKQLPPTIVSLDAKEAGLETTLFDEIITQTNNERVTLLDKQFRMRHEIARYSSQRYYEGKLETDKTAAQQKTLTKIPPCAFQHVTGQEYRQRQSNSIQNNAEALGVADILNQLLPEIKKQQWTCAVITPYQAQRNRLQQLLPEWIPIYTIDSAQGQEWDIVIFSPVRSNYKHELGFTADERRLNVAVTRAKRNFIMVGDERTLRYHEGFAELIKNAKKIRMHWPNGRPEKPMQISKPRRRRRGLRKHHKATDNDI